MQLEIVEMTMTEVDKKQKYMQHFIATEKGKSNIVQSVSMPTTTPKDIGVQQSVMGQSTSAQYVKQPLPKRDTSLEDQINTIVKILLDKIENIDRNQHRMNRRLDGLQKDMEWIVQKMKNDQKSPTILFRDHVLNLFKEIDQGEIDLPNNYANNANKVSSTPLNIIKREFRNYLTNLSLFE